jgi:hypothetical protein
VRLAVAALLAVLGLSACGETTDGGGGSMSVTEASQEAPPDTVVAVHGALVYEYGQAMLCSGLAGEEEGTKCGSPALSVDGRLDPEGWQGTWPVQWKESVTLRGTVGGGEITLAR